MNIKRDLVSIIIISIVIISVAFISGWSYQKNSFTKWEYTTGACGKKDMDSKGNEGWEMVSVADTKWTTICCCKVYYKRPKK